MYKRESWDQWRSQDFSEGGAQHHRGGSSNSKKGEVKHIQIRGFCQKRWELELPELPELPLGYATGYGISLKHKLKA